MTERALPELPRDPGTYALVLELSAPTELQVGSLGLMRFTEPFHLYFGSARGPGGLAARLRHHLGGAARPHWHIDYLCSVAPIREIWMTRNERRLECAWYAAVSTRLAGARPKARFGSSDCRCRSHLVALPHLPAQAALRGLLQRHASSVLTSMRTAEIS